ncbi:MAG: cysteine desulfurase NifS [Armatimonadetes bacterium Cent15-Ar3]|nr:MAG: cysteine desulfurase NifS [Armatimonadetes bacterium Cent15-Ar3]
MIYLDHAATSPLCAEAREAMNSAMDWFGNPSSLHTAGRQSKNLIDIAREYVTGAMGCGFPELVFTSGGTEAANLALVGLALANETSRRKIVLSAIEHHCVHGPALLLSKLGYEIVDCPVTRESCFDLDRLRELVDDNTLVVGMMSVNNETGFIQPIAEAVEIAHEKGALFFCDNVQGFRKGINNPVDQGADLVSVSAHKINGPKGIGALYVRPGTKIKPLISGGGQEREQRGGTENLFGVVGFGAACTVGCCDVRPMRDFFWDALAEAGGVPTVPAREKLLGTHAHFRFPTVDSGTLLIRLDREGICASGGSACSSGAAEPSHVLKACGFKSWECNEGIRFSFGRGNTMDDAQRAAEIVTRVVDELRVRR